MSADRKFDAKKDPAAARLVARNEKMKKNPGKGGISKRVYDGEKG